MQLNLSIAMNPKLRWFSWLDRFYEAYETHDEPSRLAFLGHVAGRCHLDFYRSSRYQAYLTDFEDHLSLSARILLSSSFREMLKRRDPFTLG